MKEKEKKKSDFRYQTGDARVLWAAVGESVTVSDIEAMLRFLIQPGENPSAYDNQMSKVMSALQDLAGKGSMPPS